MRIFVRGEALCVESAPGGYQAGRGAALRVRMAAGACVTDGDGAGGLFVLDFISYFMDDLTVVETP